MNDDRKRAAELADDRHNILDYFSNEPDRMQPIRPMLSNTTPSRFSRLVDRAVTYAMRVILIAVSITLFAIVWATLGTLRW